MDMAIPSPDGVRIYFSNPDPHINTTLDRIAQNGGEIVAPEFPIGEHGFVGLFKDTEGNVIALHRRPETN